MENKTEELKQELVFSFCAETDEITITFRGGARVLPAYIVHGLGGAEKIKEVAPSLAEVNYNDFLAAFQKTMERQQLNEIGRKFVGGHFNKRKF